jgi:hypothetical protein
MGTIGGIRLFLGVLGEGPVPDCLGAEGAFGFSFRRKVPTAYLLKAVQIVQAVQPLRYVQGV